MKSVALKPALRLKIQGLLNVTDKNFTDLLKLFNELIKPELTKNYLSHLKTAIEDLVNNRVSKSLLDELRSQNLEDGKIRSLETMVKSRTFRPFSIILVPLSSPNKKAWTKMVKSGALIYYMGNLDDRGKRVLISHELAHIALHTLASFDPVGISEDMVNLLAIIAMHDKNEFYKRDSHEFTYDTESDMLAAFKALCVGGVK